MKPEAIEEERHRQGSLAWTFSCAVLWLHSPPELYQMELFSKAAWKLADHTGKDTMTGKLLEVSALSGASNIAAAWEPVVPHSSHRGLHREVIY